MRDKKKKIVALSGLVTLLTIGASSMEVSASENQASMTFENTDVISDNYGNILGRPQHIVDAAGNRTGHKAVKVIYSDWTDSQYKTHYNSRYNTYFYRQMYGDLIAYTPWVDQNQNGKYVGANTHITSPRDIYENTNYTGGSIYKTFGTPLNADNNYEKITGHYKNPMSGATGEHRFLGYNEFGESINNPYFPNDKSVTPLERYNFVEEPWKKGGFTPDGMSSYDNPEDAFHYKKEQAVWRLINEIPELQHWDHADLMNRLSLRTDPDTSSPIFIGARWSSLGKKYWYRTITLPAKEEIQKNLTINKIIVRDGGGAVMGSYYRNSTEDTNVVGNAHKSLYRGSSYTVEVEMANTGKATINTSAVIGGSVVNGGNSNSSHADYNQGNVYKTETDTRAVLAPNEKTTINFAFAVPENNGSKIKVQGTVGGIHTDNGENLNFKDDVELIY